MRHTDVKEDLTLLVLESDVPVCPATISNGPKSTHSLPTQDVLRHKIHHEHQMGQERRKGEVKVK